MNHSRLNKVRRRVLFSVVMVLLLITGIGHIAVPVKAQTSSGTSVIVSDIFYPDFLVKDELTNISNADGLWFNILYEGGTWYLFVTLGLTRDSIELYTSADGVNFVHDSQIFTSTGIGWDDIECHSILKISDTWRMYIGARVLPGKWHVVYATSPDLINWTYQGEVYDREGVTEHCADPRVFYFNGKYYMYLVNLENTDNPICVSSNDGLTGWVDENESYPMDCHLSAFMTDGNEALCLAHTTTDPLIRSMNINLFKSVDGKNWTDEGEIMRGYCSGDHDSYRLGWPQAQIEGNKLWLYYISRVSDADDRHIARAYYYMDKGWLTGWNRRKSHTLEGSTGGSQSLYQIKINVHYGEGLDSGEDVYLDRKCRADFGDIRFTANNGLDELPYFIMKKVDGDYATVYVRVPYIPKDPDTMDIYLYYGNSGASTTSSGSATFIDFEDWEDYDDGDTLPLGDWTPDVVEEVLEIDDIRAYHGSKSLYSYDDSAVNRNTARWNFTKKYCGGFRIIDCIYQEATAGVDRGVYGVQPAPGTESITVKFDEGVFSNYHTGAWHAVVAYNYDEWHVLEICMVIGDTTYDCILDGTLYANLTPRAALTALDFIYLAQSFNGQYFKGWTDCYAIGKYSDPEPTHGAWGSGASTGAPTADSVSIVSSWDGYALYRDKGDWYKLWILVGDPDGYEDIKYVYLDFHLGDPKPIDPNYMYTYDVDAMEWEYNNDPLWSPFEYSNEHEGTYWNGYPGTNQLGVPFIFRIKPDCPITYNVNITGGGADASGNYTSGPPNYKYDTFDVNAFHIIDSGAPDPSSGGGTPSPPEEPEEPLEPGEPGYVPPDWDEVYNCTLTYDERVELYNELRYMTIRELRELCLEMGLDHQSWTTKEPYILLIFIDGYGCQPPDGEERDPNDVDDDGIPDDDEMDPWDPDDTRRLGPEVIPGGELLPRVFNFSWIQTNSSWILLLLFLLLLAMWLGRETKEKELVDIFKPLRDLT